MATALALAIAAAPSTALAQDTRVDPIPQGPERVVEALSPFRAPPDSSSVAGLLAQQAEQGLFPADDYDRVLVARLWARAGVLETALATLESIDLDGPHGDLARYEAARLFLTSGDEEGAGPYWHVCRSADPRVRAEIAWDLLAVTTPEDRQAWEELEPGEATCQWLHDFWNERAGRMAVTTAARLVTHFERLRFAADRFRLVRPRFEKSTASYHGRPGGLAMDDRGLIYVRMGAPITEDNFNDEGSGQAEGAYTIAERIEGDSVFGIQGGCWPYWRPDGYRIFCFTSKRFRADGDYVLTDRVPGSPGTQWYQRYYLNSNLARGPRTARSSGFRGLRDGWEVQLDNAQRNANRRTAQLRTRDNIGEALEQIPDVPEVFANVRILVDALRFLNPETGTWQVWVVAGASVADLKENDWGEIAVGGRFAVTGPDGVAVHEFPSVRFAGDLGPEAGLNLKGVVETRPGPLPLSVVVEDLHEPGAGNWYQGTVQIPRVGGLPQLSDIAVAPDEGGTWTRDGRTFLKVSPSHVTNPDGSIHVYFEAYNIPRGNRYSVELRLIEEDAVDRVWRLEASDLAFRLQFASEGSGSINRHHLELDLGETEPGNYLLAVRVQDQETEAYSLPSVTDILVTER